MNYELSQEIIREYIMCRFEHVEKRQFIGRDRQVR